VNHNTTNFDLKQKGFENQKKIQKYNTVYLTVLVRERKLHFNKELSGAGMKSLCRSTGS